MEFVDVACPQEAQRTTRREDGDLIDIPSIRTVPSNRTTTTISSVELKDQIIPVSATEDSRQADMESPLPPSTPPTPSLSSTPSKHDRGWRRIVRNFSTSWFAVNMGTGIASILLYQFPYPAAWLQYCGIAFFILNVTLFMVFLFVSILRYGLYPETWGMMLRHPVQSLFLGCFPMALATIITMIVAVCSRWGDAWIRLAWVLWWIDVILSLTCCISMPFIVIHRHKPGLQATTAALLLPIVPAVVASATGAVVSEVQPDHSRAFLAIIVSYILFGIGEFFSFLVLTMYFHRLHVYSLPPREAIVSVFLPVGPLGQGSFAVQKLGKNLIATIPECDKFSPIESERMHIAQIFYAVGIFCALLMWGVGFVWLAFALITIAALKRFPFNMGWWGFTFPLGVYACSTGALANELGSRPFRVLTALFSVAVVLLWVLVGARTVHLAVTGEIFCAPCLHKARVKEEDESPGSDSVVNNNQPGDCRV